MPVEKQSQTQHPTSLMNGLRQQLHSLIDQLPDSALDHARAALEYCNAPEKQRFNIDSAMRRVREKFERNLRDHAQKSGGGLIVGAFEGGHTFADGFYHGSMPAFEDGKQASCQLYVFRGHLFEVIETLKLSPDGSLIVRSERITGPDRIERTLTIELPTRHPAA